MLSIKTGSLDPEYSSIGEIECEVYVPNRRNYVKPFGIKEYEGMLPL